MPNKLEKSMKLFFIGSAVRDDALGSDLFASSMRAVGRAAAEQRHELVLCSPYPDSVDLEVLSGAASVNGFSVEYHFPELPNVRQDIEELCRNHSIATPALFPRLPVIGLDGEADMSRSWLLAQLTAMDSAHAIIAAGGKLSGSASMLLQLAEARRYPVLPLAYLGGAAAESYARLRYTLTDRFGANLTWLNKPGAEGDLMRALGRITAEFQPEAMSPATPRFFISYPKERPAEADMVAAAP